jgi:hypothetical protein
MKHDTTAALPRILHLTGQVYRVGAFSGPPGTKPGTGMDRPSLHSHCSCMIKPDPSVLRHNHFGSMSAQVCSALAGLAIDQVTHSLIAHVAPLRNSSSNGKGFM